MRKMPLTKKEYCIIAEQEDIGYGHRDAYIKFMQERFPNEQDKGYAREWAQRFRKGSQWAHADSKSIEILQKAYGIKKGKSYVKEPFTTKKETAFGKPKKYWGKFWKK